jgi:hypothetical protein
MGSGPSELAPVSCGGGNRGGGTATTSIGSGGRMATPTGPRAAPSQRSPLGPAHGGEKAAEVAGDGEAVGAEYKGWRGLPAVEMGVAGRQRTIGRSSNRGHK